MIISTFSLQAMVRVLVHHPLQDIIDGSPEDMLLEQVWSDVARLYSPCPAPWPCSPWGWWTCWQSSCWTSTSEFWRKEELINMVDMLLLMTEQVSLPTRPRFQNTINLEKLACCTGHWHACFKCGQKFKRFDKLMQHKRDKHEAARFKCICGKDFPRKGNLDRHVLNSCKKRA